MFFVCLQVMVNPIKQAEALRSGYKWGDADNANTVQIRRPDTARV